MSVIATTDGDPQLAEEAARELALKVWEKRYDILNVRKIYPVDEGVRMAMEAEKGPIILVDLGDDPGSYCPADSPVVLESLLRLGARDASFDDPRSQCRQSGDGSGRGRHARNGVWGGH